MADTFQIYLLVGEGANKDLEFSEWDDKTLGNYASSGMSTRQNSKTKEGGRVTYMIPVVSVSETCFRQKKNAADPMDLGDPRMTGVEVQVRAGDLPISYFIDRAADQREINFKVYFYREKMTPPTTKDQGMHNWMIWTGTEGVVAGISQVPSGQTTADQGDDFVFLTLKATRYQWYDYDRDAVGQLDHRRLGAEEVNNIAVEPSSLPSPSYLKKAM